MPPFIAFSINWRNWHSNPAFNFASLTFKDLGRYHSDIADLQHISITSCINVQMDIGYCSCGIILDKLIWHARCNPRAPTDMASQIQLILDDGCIYTWSCTCFGLSRILSEWPQPMKARCEGVWSSSQHRQVGADLCWRWWSAEPSQPLPGRGDEPAGRAASVSPSPSPVVGRAIMMETVFSQQLISSH